MKILDWFRNLFGKNKKTEVIEEPAAADSEIDGEQVTAEEPAFEQELAAAAVSGLGIAAKVASEPENAAEPAFEQELAAKAVSGLGNVAELASALENDEAEVPEQGIAEEAVPEQEIVAEAVPEQEIVADAVFEPEAFPIEERASAEESTDPFMAEPAPEPPPERRTSDEIIIAMAESTLKEDCSPAEEFPEAEEEKK